MKINTWKKAIIGGLLYGIGVFAVFVIYVFAFSHLLGGEGFIYKDETREVVNGISFTIVRTIAIVISAIIPIILFRYNDVDLYIICTFIAALMYAGCILFMFFCLRFEIVRTSPLNSFDALFFGVIYFPSGSMCGIFVNGAVNYFINKRTRERTER